ncbi:MAG: SRPBCC family protein [Rhodobacter sp.]|nr:SRPBCC family protein [Rhodobacter sp.]
MRFSTREDIEAPIEAVFGAVTDFDGFERQALRRGAEVTRQDTTGKTGVGSEWQVKFAFRGKQRELDARITEFDAPNGYRIDSRTGGLEGVISVDLLQLAPQRTRMQLAVDLNPRTLSARLLVQSLKFAKGTLNKRFSTRVWRFAQGIEDKFHNVG